MATGPLHHRHSRPDLAQDATARCSRDDAGNRAGSADGHDCGTPTGWCARSDTRHDQPHRAVHASVLRGTLAPHRVRCTTPMVAGEWVRRVQSPDPACLGASSASSRSSDDGCEVGHDRRAQLSIRPSLKGERDTDSGHFHQARVSQRRCTGPDPVGLGDHTSTCRIHRRGRKGFRLARVRALRTGGNPAS